MIAATTERRDPSTCSHLVSDALPANLLNDLPADLRDEHLSQLFTGKSFRIERIVSLGHASPRGFWYDQPQDEWVVVLQGEARLLFEDEAKPRVMKPGDHLHIVSHRKHRVEWTTPDGPTVWLAIHFDS